MKDFSRTAPMLLSMENFKSAARNIENRFAELRSAAQGEYKAEDWVGRASMECSVDLRYQGQGYELRVPWRRSTALLQDFHAAHQKRFGYQHPSKKIELVTLRVRASLPQPRVAVSNPSRQRSAPITRTRDRVHFGGKVLKTNVLPRESLVPGFAASGPLIVTEYTATAVVPPGWELSVHRSGALLIESQRGSTRHK